MVNKQIVVENRLCLRHYEAGLLKAVTKVWPQLSANQRKWFNLGHLGEDFDPDASFLSRGK